MKFLYYDIIFLLLSILFLVVFLIRKRKNIKVESKVFILYPTKVGLKLINYVGSRYKKSLHFLSYIVVATGYILMISSLWLFIELLRTLIKMPALFKVIKVPPIMPIFPYFTNVFKVDYLPPFYFTYWIVSIAIIAVIHEFSHGIFAKFYGVKVKSTGFGFLGPFIAAFVEPDEKQLMKKRKGAQITVLAAGSFANIVATAVFGIIIILFFKTFFLPGGVVFDVYMTNTINISDITQIGSGAVNNLSLSELSSLLKNLDKNYYDLKVNMDGKALNLTKITANGKTYFGTVEMLYMQADSLEKNNDKTNSMQVIVFEDSPAIKAGIFGAISKINSVKIGSINDLKIEMSKYKPGETIRLETLDQDYKTREYEVTLMENSKNKTQALLGIAFATDVGLKTSAEKKGIMYYLREFGKNLKEPNVFYVPSWNPSLTVFLYNLLWWIVFLNLSVALVNMLPLGIFDGGRVFYLTMLAITGSQKKAKIFFNIAMLLILLIFAILTVMWFVNI